MTSNMSFAVKQRNSACHFVLIHLNVSLYISVKKKDKWILRFNLGVSHLNIYLSLLCEVLYKPVHRAKVDYRYGQVRYAILLLMSISISPILSSQWWIEGFYTKQKPSILLHIDGYICIFIKIFVIVMICYGLGFRFESYTVYRNYYHVPLAHLVERTLDVGEVRGSIPLWHI